MNHFESCLLLALIVRFAGGTRQPPIGACRVLTAHDAIYASGPRGTSNGAILKAFMKGNYSKMIITEPIPLRPVGAYPHSRHLFPAMPVTAATSSVTCKRKWKIILR
jgi:hypothetical protein